MSDQDTWQREYEADRAKMLQGGAVDNGQRKVSADDDIAAYYGSMRPDQPSAATLLPPTGAPQPSPGGSASPVTAGYGGRTEAEALSYYAAGGNQSASTYNPTAFPLDYKDQDDRFGVKFVALPPELAALRSKVGRLVYFASTADVYFKGFFSPSKTVMGLIITPLCIWLGDLKTGALVVCKPIRDLRTLFVLGDSAVGIRSTAGCDYFIKSIPTRDRFVEVMKRLYAATGKALNVVSGAADREKSFRDEIVYQEPSESRYTVIEDPRTGLELVEVPEKHQEHYGVLCPKNLHWFGGCNHVSLNVQGKLTGTRRGCWITPTCLFLSIHTGPRPDGSHIVRCVPIESMRFVTDGPGFAIGFNILSEPPQPDLIIDVDDETTKRRILFILEQCYVWRSGEILITRKSQHFGNLKIVDDRKFVPYLHRMSTREELYKLLREK